MIIEDEKLRVMHTMPQYGRSISNKNPDYVDTYWMPPGALESGSAGGDSDWRRCGGYQRDRPLPALVGSRPRPETDWKLRDCVDELLLMRKYGVNCLAPDQISGVNGANWAAQVRWMDACNEVNMPFMIMLDCATSMGNQATDKLADDIAVIAAKPAVLKLSDGRLVVAAFKAEARTAAEWTAVFARLRTTYKIEVAFWPCFLNYTTGVNAGLADLKETYGLAEWSKPSLDGQASTIAHGIDAHQRGKKWMPPVSVQDERPRDYLAYEAQGPKTLLAAWDAAEQTDAEAVQMIAWNDWPENAAFAPSLYHGYAWLVLNYYLMMHWETGEYPHLAEDIVIIASRRQLSTVQGTYVPPSPVVYKRMGWRTNNTPVDRVYVLTLLKEPRHLETTVGGKVYTSERPKQDKPVVEDYPLANGSAPLVKVSSTGVSYSVAAPLAITASPLVQDLQYVAGVNSDFPFDLTPEEDPAVIADLQAKINQLEADKAQLQTTLSQSQANLSSTTSQLTAAQNQLGTERTARQAAEADRDRVLGVVHAANKANADLNALG